ncbi:MAG TPA: hypothetical protein GYA10_05875 [Alphaproteobacteria bacterium]|nr:hypothetical protein [Alphaproteobacteria bacterium]
MTEAGRASAAAGYRARLKARLPLLATVLAILAGLVVVGQLHWAAALVAAALVLAAGLVVPSAAGPVAAAAFSADAQPNGNLQLFADALPDPCLVLDHRSVVVHRNGWAAQQFAGIVPGDPLAFSLRAPALLAAIEAVRESGEPATVELHSTVPTETWHRATIAPLRPGEGRGVLIITLRSLTDEKRLEALRTDFIANASHELRTPLASLLGFIDTLLGPASGDRAAQQKFLEIMRAQALRMSKLIEDLLSLSRIEMRQHLRPTESVDLTLLLREVVEGFAAQASDAGVAINLDLDGGPVIVTGDRDELYEVFENLIDNALKYGAEGKRVDVSLTAATGRQGYRHLVAVTDYGPGVEAEHVPRLTERFYRVDAESSRRKRGTGLGLAIVKHILTRHHGVLTIRSRPGEGMRVEVLLPG